MRYTRTADAPAIACPDTVSLLAERMDFGRRGAVLGDQDMGSPKMILFSELCAQTSLALSNLAATDQTFMET